MGRIMGEQAMNGPKVSVDTTRMPRIPYLTYEEADESARALWDEQPRGSGADGRPRPDTSHPMFLTSMRHPDLTRVHQPYVQYLKNSTNLPVRHRELAIMRSAWLGGVDDQYVNHRLISLECGLTEDDLDRIPAGPEAPGWSPEDAAVLRAVDELDYHCYVGDQTWEELAKMYDERQLIELLLLVGNYRTLSYIQNSIGIRPVRGKTPNTPGNRFLFVES
jgi:4-carboxymuconolactone decarboxylase